MQVTNSFLVIVGYNQLLLIIIMVAIALVITNSLGPGRKSTIKVECRALMQCILVDNATLAARQL